LQKLTLFLANQYIFSIYQQGLLLDQAPFLYHFCI